MNSLIIVSTSRRNDNNKKISINATAVRFIRKISRPGTALGPLLPPATAISASSDVNALTSYAVGVEKEKVKLFHGIGWVGGFPGSQAATCISEAFCFQTEGFEFLFLSKEYVKCSCCKQPCHGTNNENRFLAKT